MIRSTTFAVLLAMSACSSSLGIDIVATYDEARSQPPDFDPDASRLRSIVDAAVSIFEDIIEDDFTVNLAFTWGDLGAEGTLGVATTLDADSGRPTSSRMRFNTNDAVGWFIDPTPNDHSEFSLVQTIVADLDTATLAESYSGSPPEQLEVGFAGVRNDRLGTTDLFSVVIHELGHAVGLGMASFGSSANDGDFDVPTRFLGGSSAGIRVSTDEDRAHLAAPRTAMFPQIVADVRRLPSATDVLAIASAAGWSELDLPRKEFVGEGSWHDSDRWIGNRIPDADDEVVVRTDNEILIDELAVADTVRILGESRIVVEGGLRANELSLNEAEHQFLLNTSFEGIEIAGSASLDGSLFVEFTESLSVGESYTLITAGDLAGEFERIDTSLPSENRGIVIDQQTNSLVATIAQVGDTDTDGDVDFLDFLTLSRNFQGEGSWRDGNFNNDSTIDFEDFLSFTENFGFRSASVGSLGEIANVPEPNSLAFLAVLTFWLLANRGDRRFALL